MAQTAEQIDTVIVGAGQAGLCMSYHLQKRGQQHILLERGRVGERWRSERWDSLRFQFESSIANLPGYPYSGPERDAFMHRDKVVQILDDYAAFIRAPVRCGVTVSALSRYSNGTFDVQCGNHTIQAKNVVAATGPYQQALIPQISHSLPDQIVQMPANRYCNPSQLPTGTTLVVGAGSSGYQIAEDLLEGGRNVILAVGRHRSLPRRYKGHDLGHWLQVTGLLDQKSEDMMPNPPTVLLSGHNRGENVDVRWLEKRGAQIVGKIEQIEGDVLTFKQNLPEILEECDAHIAGFKALLDSHADTEHSVINDEDSEMPPALETTPRELSISQNNISSVIWATGYKFDFGWIDLHTFDANGAPEHYRGVTSVPGFYFLGLQNLHKLKSAFFWGSGEDAEFIAQKIGDH